MRKGLTFIGKLDMASLHNNIRLFMQCNSEFFQKKHKDPLEVHVRKRTNFNPERPSDYGTLDTFLNRIRLEIVNECKHKQNRTDNLTK